MSRFIGKDLTLAGIQETRDPERGPVFEFTYEGTEYAVKGFANECDAAGIRCRIGNTDGVRWSCVVFHESRENIDGKSDTPKLEYEIDANLIEIDLLSSAKVEQKITAELAGEETLQIVKDQIKDALDERDESTREGLIDEFRSKTQTFKIYETKASGVEGVRVPQPVLRITRAISVKYATRLQVDQSPNAYTTAALIILLNLPASVQAQLPTNPTLKPENTTWAWVLQSQKAITDIRGNKIQETREYVFGAVHNFLYDFYQSNGSGGIETFTPS